MWNFNYSNITSVEQLKEEYADQIIKEDSEEEQVSIDEKKDDNKKSAVNHRIRNIIVFTNDKSDNNKTLKNIRGYINKHSDLDIQLYVFVAAKCTADDDEGDIIISDDDTTLDDFSEINNTNTIVFSRLGVQGEDDCEYAVQTLQDRGFLVLNPVKYSALASNKYESARLFEKGDIPQPRFCLMTKSLLKDEETRLEQLRDIYPDYSADDPDKNEKFDFVVKILDGHGGTGVFLIDGKRLIAVLQCIFAIDPERKLLLQKKEDADGGDLRVHVLTLRNKQVIIAAMKRVKIGGDFRSNVSLGATAEPVVLTDEQKDIALRTAKLSKLPWCAVDIMPLKKGSDPEVGDNVVLEINASPGTQGISEVIDENFIDVLMENLQDPKEFMLQDKNAGYAESIEVNFGKVKQTYLGRLDTGNAAMASTLEVGEYTEKDDKITFKINNKKLTYDVIDHMHITTSTGSEDRPVIKITAIKIGNRVAIDVPLALVKSRSKKSTNILINREILSELGYVVHPYLKHILTPEMEKVKII